MCIIVYVPQGVARPSVATLSQCWKINPDGAGIMYAKDGSLFTGKGYMTLESFLKVWESTPDDVPIAIHFRIKSHGELSPSMTHPFLTTDRTVAVMHNGMIQGTRSIESDPRSDTSYFVEDVLSALPSGWEDNETILSLIETRIGAGNKLCCMRADGVVKILNGTAGVWEEGIWYSNYTFRVYKPIKYAPMDGDNEYVKYDYEDDYYTKSYRQVDDGSKYCAPTGTMFTNIMWHKNSGRWIRPVRNNRGVMLYHYDEVSGGFITEGFVEWKVLKKMTPKPGEADINPPEAWAYFGIPDPSIKFSTSPIPLKFDPPTETIDFDDTKVVRFEDLESSDTAVVNAALNTQQE